MREALPTEDHLEILRIVPANRLAQQLFARCLDHVKDKRDLHHAKFMVKLPIGEGVLDAEPVEESSTEYDTAHSNNVEEQLPNGHYVISLALDKAPEFPLLGWRMGKGSSKPDPVNRNIDIMLARPGDRHSKTIPNIVISLRLEYALGIIVVSRPSNSTGKLSIKVDDLWEDMPLGKSRVLYKASSFLRTGGCLYELRYTINEEHREVFLEAKDEALNLWQDTKRKTLPSTHSGIRPRLEPLNFIPGDAHWSNGQYVRLGTFARGAFAHVHEGFDVKSCERLAIKELRVERPWEPEQVESEVTLMNALQNCNGLLPLLDYHCEHGKKKSCRIPESFYIYGPRAIHDFAHLSWTTTTQATLLQFVHQTLHGLRELHRTGIMHRDISVGNMLVLKYDPPRAVISDFGKAIRAQESSQTSLGPTKTVAPEVWLVTTNGPYGHGIDLWSYGYAMAEILDCVPTDILGQITVETWQDIRKRLEDHAQDHWPDALFVELILSMLEWDPCKRIDAESALKHPCLAGISDKNTLKRTAEDE